jgi:hypothetical protein
MGASVNAGLPAPALEQASAERRAVRFRLGLALGPVSIPGDILRVLCVRGSLRLREDVLALLGGFGGIQARIACGALLCACSKDPCIETVHESFPSLLPDMAAWVEQHAAAVALAWSQLESAQDAPRGSGDGGAAAQAPRAEWSLLSKAVPVVLPVVAGDGSVVALPLVALQNVWFRRTRVRLTKVPSAPSAQLSAALGALSLHNPLRTVAADAIAVGGASMWPAAARSLWLRAATDDEVVSCRLCLSACASEWAAGLPSMQLYICVHRRDWDDEPTHEPLYVLVMAAAALNAGGRPASRAALVFRSACHLPGCWVGSKPTSTNVGKLRSSMSECPMTIHGLLAAASVGQLIPFCSAALAAARGGRPAFGAQYTPKMQRRATDAYIKTYVNFDHGGAKNVDEELARNKLIRMTHRCLGRLGSNHPRGDHPTNALVRSFTQTHTCTRRSNYSATTTLRITEPIPAAPGRRAATTQVLVSESVANLIKTAADWNREAAQPPTTWPLYAQPAARGSVDSMLLWGAATLQESLDREASHLPPAPGCDPTGGPDRPRKRPAPADDDATRAGAATKRCGAAPAAGGAPRPVVVTAHRAA